ncbi:MAG: hypothetical protein JW787_00065 [Sedimentisphaerales bacterium]|nr:hypothetical protein [Sedimentisphaerales bacterium]
MNRYEKLAWWNLIVITFTIIITTAAIAIEFHIRGYSTLGIYFLAPLILLQYNRYLFNKPQSAGGVVSDERDSFIVQRATSFAYKSFWFVFLTSSIAVHIFKGWGRGSVPSGILPLMAIGGALFMKIMCSVSILVQYGRGGKGEKS